MYSCTFFSTVQAIDQRRRISPCGKWYQLGRWSRYKHISIALQFSRIFFLGFVWYVLGACGAKIIPLSASEYLWTVVCLSMDRKPISEAKRSKTQISHYAYNLSCFNKSLWNGNEANLFDGKGGGMNHPGSDLTFQFDLDRPVHLIPIINWINKSKLLI